MGVGSHVSVQKLKSCVSYEDTPIQGQRGGQWCPAPHLKSVPPYFLFEPLVAIYIQYCILKM